MKQYILKTKQFVSWLLAKAKQNKLWAGVILLVVLLGGYFGYQKFFASSAETRYVLAQVQKGTLVVSVSGTGQVSSSHQVDLKTKAAGDVISVNAQVGQEVKAGALLVQLNAQDALKSVRDAQAGLESAQISLAKLKQPADALSLMQAENALVQAQESKTSAQEDLDKAYDDGFNNVANAFLDLSTVMTGLQDTLLGNTFKNDQWNIDYYTDAAKKYNTLATQYRDDAYNDYIAARTAYDKNFIDYKAASRYSDTATIESLINETYDTSKKIAEAVKASTVLIQFYKDQLTLYGQKTSTTADTHLTSLTSYTSKTNTHLLNLLSNRQTIQSDKEAIVNADRTIAEKTQSLADLKAGTDALDLRAQELAVKQKENALLDAKETLANYSVRAPFDGVIASVDLKRGDSASSGAAAATIITQQRIAEITLNEVDVAKVKMGQRATLTFDAIDGLSITGQVAEVDAIGTASQGVVSYGVQISFDTQDERIKPGMSLAAAIITDTKTDVLLVANSAVKTTNGQSYVQVLSGLDTSLLEQQGAASSGITSQTAPQQQAIEVGAASDTQSEIASGLQEGDWVVARTVSATAAATQTNQNAAGGAFRILH